MDRKIPRKELIVLVSLIILIIILGIFYLIFNKEYKLIPIRFETILNKKFTNYFDYFLNDRQEILDSIINSMNEIKDNISESVSEVVNGVQGSTFKEKYYAFSHFWLNFMYNLIFYSVNLGANIILLMYMIYEIYVNEECSKVKETKLSKAFVRILKIIRFIKNLIHEFILFVIYVFKKHIKLLGILILLMFFPAAARLFLELFIGLVSYIIATINFDCWSWLFTFVKFAAVLLIPKFIKLPLFIRVGLFILAYILLALNRANKKLKKNFESVKCFARFDTAQTNLFNGPPGTGKTRLITYLGLISEENFIEDLEDMMHQIEQEDFTYNYASLDYRILKNELNDDDYELYGDYIAIYCFLYFRKSFVMSNYAIRDVYFDCYSKILKNTDLEFNNHYDDVKYGLEKYCVMCISELDKYTNSHDKGKDYYLNGVNAFFSMISHVLERKVKVYVDYQLKDQVPLMIRGNAEKQFQIIDSSYKLPLMLKPLYLIVDCLYSFFDKIAIKYSYKKKRLYSRSNRFDKRYRKRFDYSFLLSLCLFLSNKLGNLLGYLNTYSYTRMRLVEMVNDGEVVGKIKLNLNEIDSNFKGERLYNSVCFKSIYDSKKNCDFSSLDEWTSLDSTEEELKKCGMFDKVL